MKPTVLFLSVFVLLAAGCSGESPPANETSATDFEREARRIADEQIIVDTHIDVPYRLKSKPDDVAEATESGDFDYPRAVAGGLNAPFMSIYTPADLEEKGESKQVADELIDLVESIVASAPDKFAMAYSVSDVREQFEAGLMSLPLGLENGSPIEGDLANLAHFYDRGIRYITPAHSLSNHIADSSYDDNRQWGGLSPFGRDVIREMNRLGIMIDVSHVSDDAFWEIMEMTEAPVIASHSSARHFTPGFERNMSDDMIKAVGAAGGVIHINFGSTFVTAEARAYSDARSAAAKEYRKANPEFGDEDEYTKFPAIYAAEHGPLPFATLHDVLDHFDHVVALTGVDHVGIGSDYDGVGDSLPIGLKDVSTYPALIAGLLRRGYTETDVEKILGENLLRVWGEVEAHAAAD